MPNDWVNPNKERREQVARENAQIKRERDRQAEIEKGARQGWINPNLYTPRERMDRWLESKGLLNYQRKGQSGISTIDAPHLVPSGGNADRPQNFLQGTNPATGKLVTVKLPTTTQPIVNTNAQTDWKAQNFDWMQLSEQQKKEIISNPSFRMNDVQAMGQQGLILSDSQYGLYNQDKQPNGKREPAYGGRYNPGINPEGTGYGPNKDLQWWQPAAYTALSNPYTAPAVQGASLAIMSGGNPGGLLAAAGITAAGYATMLKGSENPLANWVGEKAEKGLYVLNWGAQTLEQTAGTLDYLRGGDQASKTSPIPIVDIYRTVKDVIEAKRLGEFISDPELRKAVWDSSVVYYDTKGVEKNPVIGNFIDKVYANDPQKAADTRRVLNAVLPITRDEGEVWVLGEAEPVPVKPGYTMDDARKKMLSGEYTTDTLMAEYQQAYGFSGVASDFLLQSVFDPLNVVDSVVSETRGKIADARAARLDAVGTPEAIARAQVERIKAQVYYETPSANPFTDKIPWSETAKKIRAGLQEAAGTSANIADALTPWERKLAGITPDGKIAELTPSAPSRIPEFIKNIFELNPDAKLRLFLDRGASVMQGLFDYARGESMSASDMIGTLRSVANADMTALKTAGAEYLSSPEAYTIISQAKDFLPQMEAQAQTFDALAAERQRVIDTLTALGGDKTVMHKGFTQADWQRLLKTDNPLKADIDAGRITYDSLRKDFDLFKYRKDGTTKHALTMEEFSAKTAAAFEDHVLNWGKDYFGVKQATAFEDGLKALKGLQSLLLLDISPTSIMNDIINERVMIATTGTLGLTDSATIAQFMDDMGVKNADAQSTGGMGDAARANPDPVSKLTRGNSVFAKAADAIQSVRSKLPRSKITGMTNEAHQLQVRYHEMKKFMSRYWTEGQGFKRMSPSLESRLREYGYDPATVYQNLRGTFRPEQIDALMNRATNVDVQVYVQDAATVLGKDPASTRAMLDELGILDNLKASLEKAQTPEQRALAFDRVTDTAMNSIDVRMARQLKTILEQTRNKIKMEGPAGTIQVFQEMALDYLNRKMDNDRIWDEAYQVTEGMEPDQRNTVMSKAARDNRAAWTRTQARQAALYVAAIEGLGMTNDFGRAFLANLGEEQRVLRKYFEDHGAKADKLSRQGGAWYEAFAEEFNTRWAKDYGKVMDLQRKRGKMFVEEMKRTFGEKAEPMAQQWIDGVVNATGTIDLMTREHRDGLKGLPFEERKRAWETFKPEALKAWAERTRLDMAGAANLYKWDENAPYVSDYLDKANADIEVMKQADNERRAGVWAVAEEFGFKQDLKSKGHLEFGVMRKPEYGGIPDLKGLQDPRMTPELTREVLTRRAEMQAEQARMQPEIPTQQPTSQPLTKSAIDFLKAATEEGAMPAFITNNLRRIAGDNGINVTNQMTAADVVAALQARAAQPAPTASPAQTANRIVGYKIGDNTKLGTAIKEMGGISTNLARDLIGDTDVRRAGNIFKINGRTDIDLIAIELAEYGYPIDLNNPDDIGGLNQLRDIIQRQVAGSDVYPMGKSYDKATEQAARAYANEQLATEQTKWRDEADTLSRALDEFDTTAPDAEAKALDLMNRAAQWYDTTESIWETPHNERTLLDAFTEINERAGTLYDDVRQFESMVDDATRAAIDMETMQTHADGSSKRQAIHQQSLEIFGEEQGAHLNAITDLQADQWARMTGRTREEFYVTRYDAIRREGGGEMYQQTPFNAERYWQQVFHGSPYRFDKFTLDKIGSGEGAQAYGWGLYFAGDKAVAEWYREVLSNDWTYNGKSSESYKGSGIHSILDSVAKSGDISIVERTIKNLNNKIESAVYHAENPLSIISQSKHRMNGEEWVEYQASVDGEYKNSRNKSEVLEWIKDKSKTEVESITRKIDELSKIRVEDFQVNKGQLYKVEIPDENYLLWDEPLSEQSEAVRQAVQKLADDYGYEYTQDYTGGEFYKAITTDMNADGIPNGRDPQRVASEMLKDMGVTGIQYLDGSSRGKGEGNYNYVIFDDAAIDILETYYQQAGVNAKGGVDFAGDGRATIYAMQSADVSTGIHEHAHVFLESLYRSVDEALPKYKRGLEADTKTLKDWTSVKQNGDTWTATNASEYTITLRDGQYLYQDPSMKSPLTFDTFDQAKYRLEHEMFARGFEKYMADGKAPSIALRNLFMRFSEWLKEIYNSAVKQQAVTNVEISEPMRELYNRLLTFDHDAPYGWKGLPDAESRRATTDILVTGDIMARAQAERERLAQPRNATIEPSYGIEPTGYPDGTYYIRGTDGVIYNLEGKKFTKPQEGKLPKRYKSFEDAQAALQKAGYTDADTAIISELELPAQGEGYKVSPVPEMTERNFIMRTADGKDLDLPTVLYRISQEKPGKTGYTKTQIEYITQRLTEFINNGETLRRIEIDVPGDNNRITVTGNEGANNLYNALTGNDMPGMEGSKKPKRQSGAKKTAKERERETIEYVNAALRLYGDPQRAADTIRNQMGIMQGDDISPVTYNILGMLEELTTKTPEEQAQAVDLARNFQRLTEERARDGRGDTYATGRTTIEDTPPALFQADIKDRVWQYTLAEYADVAGKDFKSWEIEQTHRVAVEQAYHRGDPIPEAVLDEYPYLLNPESERYNTPEAAAMRDARREELARQYYSDRNAREEARFYQQDSDPAPIPTLPPGGYDQHSGFMDVGKILYDGWSDEVKPVLDEMKRASQKKENRYNFEGMDNTTRKELNLYLAEKRGELATAKNAARRWGDEMVDFTILDYRRQYGFDKLLGAAVPYEFYGTRSMLNWATRLMDRPQYLSHFARLQHLRETYDSQLPERMRGKYWLPTPFAPEWGGDGVFIDPKFALFPWTQFMQPLEAMKRENANITNSAAYQLRNWAEEGTITEAEAAEALNARSGPLWEKAMEQSRIDQGENLNSSADYFSMLFGPALYLTVPYYLATGEKFAGINSSYPSGQLPVTRTAQALETAFKGTPLEWLGNTAGLLTKPENMAREALDLPKYGEWGDYYIDRQLVNMAAEGLYTAEQVQIAMLERKGPIYDKADERVRYEMMLRIPGMAPLYNVAHGATFDQVVGSLLPSLFPGGLLPPAEMEYKGLKQEYGIAWDQWEQGNKDALNQFFENNPEYQARLALRRDPQERLEQFLKSQIWEGYGELGPTDKKTAVAEANLQEFFNAEPGQSFSIEQLTQWAQMLNKRVPKTEQTLPAIENPRKINFLSSEVTSITDQYYEQRKRMYPDYYDLEQGYYNLPKSERRSYLVANPNLKEYWDWKRSWYDRYPDLVPVFKGEVFRQVDTSTWNPALVEFVADYAYSGAPLPAGAYKALTQVWINEGQPRGSLDDWLKQDVAPSLLYGN